MHLIYGLEEGNAQAAERLSRKRNPQRDASGMFANLHQNLCESGALQDNRYNLNTGDYVLFRGIGIVIFQQDNEIPYAIISFFDTEGF
ncbi:hypothetical protein TNCV_4844981 [Trichonephila clavipes]|uniref:Uncharacterized protein n=1 Tax=Trichonephila clavipes TaxID=2585209 RepID=A0A8X6WLA5_TRICX|nr:hypothetical protein TNCV_4844981 [Trichonephila clavipes]